MSLSFCSSIYLIICFMYIFSSINVMRFQKCNDKFYIGLENSKWSLKNNIHMLR